MRPLAILLVLWSACAPGWKSLPHDQRFQHNSAPTLHRRPATTQTSGWWEATLQSTVLPLARLVSPARLFDRLRGGRPALDINAFGQVPDSSWFQNRLGRVAMSPQDVARGPAPDVPEMGPLLVRRGQLHHATPTLFVEDATGATWVARFDAPAFRELSTGAEMIASRLLYAMGYHVPNVQLLDIRADRFQLAEKAVRPNRYNQWVSMTRGDLDGLLSNLNPSPNGTLRAVFYRTPGQPVGQFTYRGVRRDDPNDLIPHERRRSLRGLWVFAAWLNDTDTRPTNTLDTFVPMRGDLGFVRHYLIGFGDALGAAGERAKYLGESYEAQLDWSQLGLRWLGIGALYPYWLTVEPSPYLAVGLFESRVFDPARWTPRVPNPAFNEATALDTFWAASILARITRDHIAAAVALARYRHPEVSEHIIDILLARRDKLLRHVFKAVLPVDAPLVTDGYRLALVDLEHLAGLREHSEYRISVRWTRTRRSDPTLSREVSSAPTIDLRSTVAAVLTKHRAAFIRDPFLTLRFSRVGHPAWVDVHVRVAGNRVLPVAVERVIDHGHHPSSHW